MLPTFRERRQIYKQEMAKHGNHNTAVAVMSEPYYESLKNSAPVPFAMFSQLQDTVDATNVRVDSMQSELLASNARLALNLASIKAQVVEMQRSHVEATDHLNAENNALKTVLAKLSLMFHSACAILGKDKSLQELSVLELNLEQ